MERPKIKDYFAEKAGVKTVHNEYTNSPHLYSYASNLDRYVDYLEDKLNNLVIAGVSNRRELLIAEKGNYVTYIGGGKGKYLILGKKYEVQKDCNGEFIIVKNEIGRRQIYNTYFFSK
jgi:hypothetical protein